MEISVICVRDVLERLPLALEKYLPTQNYLVKHGCGTELDECFFRESFKGNHMRSGVNLPRKARKRTQTTDGYEKICVLTGINDSGDVFYEIAGRGGLGKEEAVAMLAGKLASGAIVSTDKANIYRYAFSKVKAGEHKSFVRDKHAINRVDGLHSHIKKFIGRFHGVATRRLENYLSWFKWIWSFKIHKSANQLADLVIKQATKFTYETTWREYKVTPYPFFEYWVKQAKWDERARRAIYGQGVISNVV